MICCGVGERTTNEARNVAIYLCRRLSGETLVRIGKEFHLDNYGSVSSVVSSHEEDTEP